MALKICAILFWLVSATDIGDCVLFFLHDFCTSLKLHKKVYFDTLTILLIIKRARKLDAKVGHICEFYIILEPQTWNSTTRYIWHVLWIRKKQKSYGNLHASNWDWHLNNSIDTHHILSMNRHFRAYYYCNHLLLAEVYFKHRDVEYAYCEIVRVILLNTSKIFAIFQSWIVRT